MKKLAKDLTDAEREIFVEAFYEITDSRLDDLDTGSPWGCPWYWGTPVTLEGSTIEEMAENFHAFYENIISFQLNQEEVETPKKAFNDFMELLHDYYMSCTYEHLQDMGNYDIPDDIG